MAFGAEQLLSSSNLAKASEVHPMKPHFEVLKSAVSHLNSVAVAILTSLEKPLDLPDGTFASLSDIKKPTSSQLRFLHYAPSEASE